MRLLIIFLLLFIQSSGGRISKNEFTDRFEKIVTNGEKNKVGSRKMVKDGYDIQLNISISTSNLTCLQTTTYSYVISKSIEKNIIRRSGGVKHAIGICKENKDTDTWVTFTTIATNDGESENIYIVDDDIVISSYGFNSYNLLKVLN